MNIIIGKVQKLKTKYKTLSLEIAVFDNFREFYRGIGDDYQFLHHKHTENKIFLMDSKIKDKCFEIKHIGIISNELWFRRVNSHNFHKIFANHALDDFFSISKFSTFAKISAHSFGYEIDENYLK